MDNYYSQIKEQIINNEITKQVKNYSINRTELTTYYNIGKLLTIAGKHYGEGIIKKYSIKLTNEFGKGYSKRNLWLMLKFYELSKKMQAVPAQLSWSHYCELLPINSLNEINYYIKITIEQNLGYRKLREKIKSKEYERLPKETKFKLLKKDNDK